MKKNHNKLVRDKIPQKLSSKGVKYQVINLNPIEAITALTAKLREEFDEFWGAQPEDKLSELADLVTVLRELRFRLFGQQRAKVNSQNCDSQTASEKISELILKGQKNYTEDFFDKIESCALAWIKYKGIDQESFEKIIASKIETSGAFDENYFLIYTEE